jgi:hypothetical protein
MKPQAKKQEKKQEKLFWMSRASLSYGDMYEAWLDPQIKLRVFEVVAGRWTWEVRVYKSNGRPFALIELFDEHAKTAKAAQRKAERLMRTALNRL